MKNKTMKRILPALLLAALVLGMTGCGQTQSEPDVPAMAETTAAPTSDPVTLLEPAARQAELKAAAGKNEDAKAWLCIPGAEAIFDADVDALEHQLDHYNEGLPFLKEFILPGGGEASARCHIARTVVRRAERATVALAHAEEVRPQPRRYLNRLSDLLFVLARVLAHTSGHGEVMWNHERRRRPAAK